MKKIQLEGGIESFIKNDSEHLREKIEANLDLLAESIGSNGLEILSFDGKRALLVAAENVIVSAEFSIDEEGSVHAENISLVEEAKEDDSTRRELLKRIVESVLDDNIESADEAWEELVEAYRPFVIKGQIGRRHTSRAYYKARRKSAGKGVVRSRKTGAIIRRMKGRERQKRKYSSIRTARRGSTKRNRERSLKRRDSFNLKRVQFNCTELLGSLLSENTVSVIRDFDTWTESAFTNWVMDQPADALIFVEEDGSEHVLIPSVAVSSAAKREFRSFNENKKDVSEGRKTARKLHRNVAFQEQVQKLADKKCDVTALAEEIIVQNPNVAFVGKKSLVSQFAYCLGKCENKQEVPAEKLNALAEAVIDAAWEFNPDAIKKVASAASGWLFPESYDLPDDAIEAWRLVSEQFDIALIAEAKELRDLVQRLCDACSDAKKTIEEMLPSVAEYQNDDASVLRGIHNVLQSHCASLSAFGKNPQAIDQNRLAAIVDYLDDLSDALGKNLESSADAGQDDDGREYTGVDYASYYDSEDILPAYQLDGNGGIDKDPISTGLASIDVEYNADHLMGDTMADINENAVSNWSNITMEGYKISGSFSATIANDEDGSEESEESEEPEMEDGAEGEAEIAEYPSDEGEIDTVDAEPNPDELI